MVTTSQIEDYVMDMLDDCTEKKNSSVCISLSKFAGATEAICGLPYELSYRHIKAEVYNVKGKSPYVEVKGYKGAYSATGMLD